MIVNIPEWLLLLLLILGSAFLLWVGLLVLTFLGLLLVHPKDAHDIAINDRKRK